MIRRPVTGSQWLDGIGDALELMRGPLRKLAGDAGSANRKQLDDTLEHLAALLWPAPPTPVGISRKLTELALLARKLAGIVQKLSQSQHESAGNEALIGLERSAHPFSVTNVASTL